MSVSSASRTCAADASAPEFDRLAEAFSRYQSELLGTLFHALGNGEDAQDAFQETFLKCWRRRADLGVIKNLRAWIFQVALNTGRDMRKTAWKRRRRTFFAPEVEAASSSDTAFSEQNHEAQLTQIRHALCGLRMEEKSVFLLRQNAEMTYEEIAQSLGIPLGTVKTRMRLALSKLRAAVEGETP